MSKGQISIPIATVGAILIAVVGWSSSYFGNLSAQSASIAEVKTDVAVLKNFKDTQVVTNDDVNKKLDRLNENIVRLLIHIGIQPASQNETSSR